MARELEDWLTAYLEYTDSSEPPTSFHAWAGLAVIAGALQRKVYITHGLGPEIFPNLYVVLIAPSGRCRKGVALGIAKSFLADLPDVNIAPESSSGREALVSAMIHNNKDFTDPDDGKVKTHCAMSIFSEEMAVFFGQQDTKLLANFTDWHDGKNPWRYETIRRGIDTIKGICVNMVTATAPDWLASMLPPEAMGGGFTARCIFIVEEWKKHAVPSHTMTPRELELRDKLKADLIRINALAGQFRFDPDAQALYDAWYNLEDKKAESGYMPVRDYRFAAYNERRATHLRKVMMCLSASRGDSLVLTVEDFNRGLSMLLQAERKMAKTFGSFSVTRQADATDKVMEYIRLIGITTKKLVLQKFYRDVDDESLETIELNLWKEGLIKVSPLPEMGDKKYEYVEQTQH